MNTTIFVTLLLTSTVLIHAEIISLSVPRLPAHYDCLRVCREKAADYGGKMLTAYDVPNTNYCYCGIDYPRDSAGFNEFVVGHVGKRTVIRSGVRSGVVGKRNVARSGLWSGVGGK